MTLLKVDAVQPLPHADPSRVDAAALERAPLELLAIMPPTVARLAVDTSGAKRNPWGRSRALSSSSTIPGSTSAQRSSTFRSSTALRCFDVSTTRPVPMAWPHCEVPPPRRVSGQPKRAQIRTMDTRSCRVRGSTTPSGFRV